MTFSKDQVVTNEEWLRRHKGHKVTEEHEDFHLYSGAIRRLNWWCCADCSTKHLHKMETIECQKKKNTKQE